jgi:hypothetical protein
MTREPIILRNGPNGDVLEVSLPDDLGASVVLLNGREVAMALHSINDNGEGSITIGDGNVFSKDEWCAFLVEQFRTGAWRP